MEEYCKQWKIVALKNSSGRLPFTDYKLNLRIVIAVYYMGGGVSDIMKVLLMMGIKRVNFNLKREYYRVAPQTHHRVINISKGIIKRAMKQEILRTISETQKHLSSIEYTKSIQNEMKKQKIRND